MNHNMDTHTDSECWGVATGGFANVSGLWKVINFHDERNHRAETALGEIQEVGEAEHRAPIMRAGNADHTSTGRR